MTDNFERLKEALQRDPPPPDPKARQVALANAMARFEEKNADALQGITVEARPTSSDGIGPSAIWSRIMNALKPSSSNWTPVLAGGASLAVLMIAVVSTGVIRPGLFDRQDVSLQKTKLELAGADKLVNGAVQPEERARDNERAQYSGLPSPTKPKEAPGQIYQDQGRDRFEAFDPNPVKVVAEDPVSTFSVDVDTASYAFMRARLNQGVLPTADSVRVEEFINYFPYDYAVPDSLDTPFKANVSIMPTPWNAQTKLMRIGIKGYMPPAMETPRANLVFLIDTSGSMNAPDKLPLLRNAFGLLLTSLHPDDTVAIVTYAGSAGTALEPTKVSDSANILAALDNLSAGGSTAGGEGIRQAYALAEANKVDGINRVILATDGDFNVGISDTETLKDFVATKRETGVSLSVLGFGAGNYNDALMQALAQNGNGNAAYIDSLTEARKVLVEDVAATLQTIAKDVKIQVEFNPAAVSEYRLIGYETRMLNREDFNNDKVDAGEIGAGHTVTALYEITPAGSEGRLVDDLRYQSAERPAAEPTGEIAFVKIRYKQPNGDKSTLVTTPVTRANEVASIAAADTDARFAAAVAGFGQLLKGGQYTGNWSIQDATALAEGAQGEDRFGYRNEFVNLTRLAKTAAAMAPLRK